MGDDHDADHDAEHDAAHDAANHSRRQGDGSVDIKWIAGIGGSALVMAAGMWVMGVANTADSAMKVTQAHSIEMAVIQNDRKNIEATLDTHTRLLQSISDKMDANAQALNSKIDAVRSR